jgi:hypothetical protein
VGGGGGKGVSGQVGKPVGRQSAHPLTGSPAHSLTPARGRPSVFRAEFCARVIAFMAQGFSLTAFAGEIGVSRETVYEWGKTLPQFSDALTRARAARALYWERRLLSAEKDSRAVIFALRNACGDEWRDKPDVQVSVHNTVDLSRPPEEWGETELVAELRKRGALPAPGQ